VGRAQQAPVVIHQGDVPSAGRVWTDMKAGLTMCFNRALADHPNQHGGLVVAVNIGTRGEVRDAQAQGGHAGLSDETIECVLRRIKGATFLPPEPSGSMANLLLSVEFEVTDDPGPVPL